MHLRRRVAVGLHPARDLVHLLKDVLVEAATTLLLDILHVLRVTWLVIRVKLQLVLLQDVERNSVGCLTFFGQSLNQLDAVLRLVVFLVTALLEFAIVYECVLRNALLRGNSEHI